MVTTNRIICGIRFSYLSYIPITSADHPFIQGTTVLPITSASCNSPMPFPKKDKQSINISQEVNVKNGFNGSLTETLAIK